MYRVMIIEDEEDIRLGLVECIPWDELGFEVVGQACDGEEALLIIPSVAPDVIVTDIRMPGMDGLELMERLYSIGSKIKIVILSGYSDFEYAKKGVDFGASAYLLKPTKDEEIIDVFNRLKEELDNQNNERDIIDKYLSKTDENSILLKEKLVLKLFEGYEKIDENEIINKLLNFGFKPDYYYFVIILQFEKEKEFLEDIKKISKEDYIILFEDVISKKISGIVSVVEVLFSKEYSECKILISSGKIIDKKEGKEITEEIIEVFINETKLKDDAKNLITVGVGGVVKGITNSIKSKDGAIKALNNRFYKGMGTIIHINECKELLGLAMYKTKQIDIYKENELRNNLIEAIFLGNDNSITPQNEKYFEFFKKNNFDAELTYIKIGEFIFQLVSKLKEKEIEVKDIFDNEALYKKIANNQTFDDLKKWVNEFSHRILKLIKNIQYFKMEPIKKVIIYIEENYMNKINLEELADIAYMSSSYFSRFFKQKTDMNIKDFIIETRINKAKELLLNPEKKVYEVSSFVGYDDYRHFCKVFKVKEGISPTKFRDLNKV